MFAPFSCLSMCELGSCGSAVGAAREMELAADTGHELLVSHSTKSPLERLLHNESCPLNAKIRIVTPESLQR